MEATGSYTIRKVLQSINAPCIGLFHLKCVFSCFWAWFSCLWTSWTAAVFYMQQDVCLRLKSHTYFHRAVGWCVVQSSCLCMTIIGGKDCGSINYRCQEEADSPVQTLEQLSALQHFTWNVPLHTILNIKQFVPLMNYRHDAAALGQFSRIFCMTCCSHPFIIRHQLTMKNQWNRS